MPTFEIANTTPIHVRSLVGSGDVDANTYRNLLYVHQLTFQADDDNAGSIYIGDSNVSPTNRDAELAAGDSADQSQPGGVDNYLTIDKVLAAPGAPTVANGAGPLTAPVAPTVANGAAGTNLLEPGEYRWKITFVTANGETEAGTASATLTNSPAGELPPELSVIPTGPAGTTQRKIYRTEVDGSDYKLVATLNNNTTTVYTDNVPDASLTTAAPSVNTTATNLLTAGAYKWKITFVTAEGESEAGAVSAEITNDPAAELPPALSAIPTDATAGVTVTSRKVYRTVAGGSVYKLSGTIADNTTTTYTDNIADASLGATAPTTNSAVPMKVNMMWESTFPLELS